MTDRTPPPEQVNDVAERVMCRDIVELDAGHFAMITHPQAFADVLNDIHARSFAAPFLPRSDRLR